MSDKEELGPGAKVARGATYVFIQGFISAAMGVVFIVFLTRLISQEEMGMFGVLTFLLGLIQTLGLLALPSASIKYIAQFIAEGNREKAKAVTVRVLQVSIVVAVAAFALTFVLSNWISATLSCPPQLIQALALASIFVILFYQALAFLQGLQMMGKVAATNLLFSFVQYGLALYLVFIGFGLLGIIIGWLVALATAFIGALIFTRKSLGISGKSYPLRPLLSFSMPLYISGILGFIILWIDQLFVLPYLGLETFAAYNIANRAAVVPGLISTALVAALFPKLSQLYTEQGKKSLEDAFKVTTRYVVLVGFPMIIAIAVLAYPIMILFAGTQYAEAAFPLTILCIASLFGAVGVAIHPTFLTIERTGIASLITFASIVVDALSSYILISFFNMGMNGAAIAKVIASVVGFFLGAIILARFIRVKFDTEILWKVSLSCFFMVAVILGFDVLRQQLSGTHSFLVFRLHLLPVYVLIGAVAYVIAIISLGAIKKEDIELFHEYLPNKLKPVATLLERFLKTKRTD